MIEKYNKTCKYLNYLKSLLHLSSTISDCVLIPAFVLLVDINVGITSSSVGISICAIIAGIKEYKSMIKRKSKKHDKIMLLWKDKLKVK